MEQWGSADRWSRMLKTAAGEWPEEKDGAHACSKRSYGRGLRSKMAPKLWGCHSDQYTTDYEHARAILLLKVCGFRLRPLYALPVFLIHLSSSYRDQWAKLMENKIHVLEGALIPVILLYAKVKWRLMCFFEMCQYLHNENIPVINMSTVFNIW